MTGDIKNRKNIWQNPNFYETAFIFFYRTSFWTPLQKNVVTTEILLICCDSSKTSFRLHTHPILIYEKYKKRPSSPEQITCPSPGSEVGGPRRLLTGRTQRRAAIHGVALVAFFIGRRGAWRPSWRRCSRDRHTREGIKFGWWGRGPQGRT